MREGLRRHFRGSRDAMLGPSHLVSFKRHSAVHSDDEEEDDQEPRTTINRANTVELSFASNGPSSAKDPASTGDGGHRWMRSKPQKRSVTLSHDGLPIIRSSLKDKLSGQMGLSTLSDATQPYYLYCRSLIYLISAAIYVVGDTYDPPEFSLSSASFLEQHRPVWVRVIQLCLCSLTIVDSVLRHYVIDKANWKSAIKLDWVDIINIVCFVPAVIALVTAHNALISPSFLHVWGFRQAVKLIALVHIETLARNGANSEILLFGAYDKLVLGATLFSTVFTCACGVEHLARNESADLSLFDAVWFTMVTLSTVGFGDYAPENVLGRIWVMGMIVLLLLLLPRELGTLAETYRQARLTGGRYVASSKRPHVVFCAGDSHVSTVRDFLSEFFPLHSNVAEPPPYVVFLMSKQPCRKLISLLRHPRWRRHTRVITGSALVQQDLERAQVEHAQAVFIVSERHGFTAEEADERAVMRSWAINDYHPSVQQYIQILLPENKKHLKNVNSVTVCTGEIRYALLSYSCITLGVSTLITQLLHSTYDVRVRRELQGKFALQCETERQLTSRIQKSPQDTQQWLRHQHSAIHTKKTETILQYLYTICAGNEFYAHDMTNPTEAFPAEYIGMPFYRIIYEALKKKIVIIGVETIVDPADVEDDFSFSNPSTSLVMNLPDGHQFMGSRPMNETPVESEAFPASATVKRTILNPGPLYKLKNTDTLIYIARQETDETSKVTAIDQELNEFLFLLSRNPRVHARAKRRRREKYVDAAMSTLERQKAAAQHPSLRSIFAHVAPDEKPRPVGQADGNLSVPESTFTTNSKNALHSRNRDHVHGDAYAPRQGQSTSPVNDDGKKDSDGAGDGDNNDADGEEGDKGDSPSQGASTPTGFLAREHSNRAQVVSETRFPDSGRELHQQPPPPPLQQQRGQRHSLEVVGAYQQADNISVSATSEATSGSSVSSDTDDDFFVGTSYSIPTSTTPNTTQDKSKRRGTGDGEGKQGLTSSTDAALHQAKAKLGSLSPVSTRKEVVASTTTATTTTTSATTTTTAAMDAPERQSSSTQGSSLGRKKTLSSRHRRTNSDPDSTDAMAAKDLFQVRAEANRKRSQSPPPPAAPTGEDTWGEKPDASSDIIVGLLPANAIYLGSAPIRCGLVTKAKRKKRIVTLDALPSKALYALTEWVVVDIEQFSQSYDGSGIYFFIAHLRAVRSVEEECFQHKPVLLLLKDKPLRHFRKFIRRFPDVYYHIGDLRYLPSKRLVYCLEKAYIVLMLKSSLTDEIDDTDEANLIDAKSILTVAHVSSQFPETKYLDELAHRDNIRFTQYSAVSASKKGIHHHSPLSFLYRSAYQSGSAFSASMLDSLVYQAYRKSEFNLTVVVQQLLGVSMFADPMEPSMVPPRAYERERHGHHHHHHYWGSGIEHLPFSHTPHAQPSRPNHFKAFSWKRHNHFGSLAQVVITEPIYKALGEDKVYDSLVRYLLEYRSAIPLGLLSETLKRCADSYARTTSSSSVAEGNVGDTQHLPKRDQKLQEKVLASCDRDMAQHQRKFTRRLTKKNLKQRIQQQDRLGSETASHPLVLINPPLITPVGIGDIVYVVTHQGSSIANPFALLNIKVPQAHEAVRDDDDDDDDDGGYHGPASSGGGRGRHRQLNRRRSRRATTRQTSSPYASNVGTFAMQQAAREGNAVARRLSHRRKRSVLEKRVAEPALPAVQEQKTIAEEEEEEAAEEAAADDDADEEEALHEVHTLTVVEEEDDEEDEGEGEGERERNEDENSMALEGEQRLEGADKETSAASSCEDEPPIDDEERGHSSRGGAKKRVSFSMSTLANDVDDDNSDDDDDDHDDEDKDNSEEEEEDDDDDDAAAKDVPNVRIVSSIEEEEENDDDNDDGDDVDVDSAVAPAQTSQKQRRTMTDETVI